MMLLKKLPIFVFTLALLTCKVITQDSYQSPYHTNLRYYDAKIGKFTQPDTINPDPTNSRSFNRYMYVNNNPLKFTDPSGHIPHNKNQSEIEEIQTHAYVFEFASSNGRYTHLVEESLNKLVGSAGNISLGEPIPLPIAQEHYSSLQEIIGFENPSDITARRIYMTRDISKPISYPTPVQHQMFDAMMYAFTGNDVYIQSSRYLLNSDLTRNKWPNNLPRILKDTEADKFGVTYSMIGQWHYIYVPSGGAPESKYTVGQGGNGIRQDRHTTLGHEIGHVFNRNRVVEAIHQNIDQVDPKDQQDFVNRSLDQDNHPSSPSDEIFRRRNGIRDLTLDFENQLVRPALNKTFGYEKYKRREYYHRDTYSQTPRGFWQR